MEEFFKYSKNLNPITAECMERLLSMEADFKTLQVVYNSMEDPKNERLKLRETLCPAMG